jgi:hypothetical protein
VEQAFLCRQMIAPFETSPAETGPKILYRPDEYMCYSWARSLELKTYSAQAAALCTGGRLVFCAFILP